MTMGIDHETCQGTSEVSILYPIMNRIIRTVLAAAVVCGVAACVMGPRKTAAERQADKDMADRVQPR